MNNFLEALLPDNHPSVEQDSESKCFFYSRKVILFSIVDKEEGFQRGYVAENERIQRTGMADHGCQFGRRA